jgi:tetratricopeptide (TPR) repeat protein
MFFPTEDMGEVYGAGNAILAVHQQDRKAIFMRRLALATLFLLVCPIAIAQHQHAMAAPGRISPCTKNNYKRNEANTVFNQAALDTNLQKVIWPVSHADTEKGRNAQKYFSQGMTEYYGFNYEEALRNFRSAGQQDPDMAMAWWGVGLAAGPNINIGMDDQCREVALSAIACAKDLLRDFKLRPVEIGLIDALALRYAGPLTETTAYAVAMRHVWEKAKTDWDQPPQEANKKHDAENVGALYAESMIELRPWGLFDAAYREALDTPTILNVLLEAMKPEPNSDVSKCIDSSQPNAALGTCPDPDAIGAVHFYIHAIEASLTPRFGEKSANVLNDAKAPRAGHLLHMPSHIYLLMGEYLASMQSNTEAVKTDKEQYGKACEGSYGNYADNVNCPQLYYGHYLSHNLFFRTVSAAFNGQSKEAQKSACETRNHATRFEANEPGLQRYMTAPLMTLVMNRNWSAILDGLISEEHLPADCDMTPFAGNGCHIYRAMWHWARGMAYAADGDSYNAHVTNLRFARTEYDLMAVEMLEIAPPTPTGWGNNTAAAVLSIAQSTLQARYTWAGGSCRPCVGCGDPPCKAVCDVSECRGSECSDTIDQGIEHLKLAVTHEDALVYDEPPQWFPPTREALGGAYLRVAKSFPNNTTDQAQKRIRMFELAEKTFDEDLLRHSKSGRSLYGKMLAIEGQGKSATAAKKAFCEAWGNADYVMTEKDLWPAIGGARDAADVDSTTCEARETVVKAPTKDSCPSSLAAAIPKAKQP